MSKKTKRAGKKTKRATSTKPKKKQPRDPFETSAPERDQIPQPLPSDPHEHRRRMARL